MAETKVRILERPLPGLRYYHVVFASDPSLAPAVLKEALDVGRRLARRQYGSGGGFVVLFSEGEAQRRPWPHAHVVPVRDVLHKRWVLGLLLFKRTLIRLEALWR